MGAALIAGEPSEPTLPDGDQQQLLLRAASQADAGLRRSDLIACRREFVYVKVRNTPTGTGSTFAGR